MKNSLFLWILTFLFSVNSSFTEAQSKYEELELRGPVKSVQQVIYSQDNLKESPKIYLFSPTKVLSSMLAFHTPKEGSIFVYDLLERPLGVFKNDFEHQTLFYQYNEEKKELFVYKEKLLMIYGKLDDHGNIIELTSSANQDDPELRLNDPKQFHQINQSVYDQNRNEVSSNTFAVVEGEKVIPILEIKSIFNQRNQMIRQERWRVDRKEALHKRTFIYNADHFQTEIKGIDIIEEKELDRGSFLHTHHQWDDHGNWLHRTTKLNGVEVYNEKRKIEYY